VFGEEHHAFIGPLRETEFRCDQCAGVFPKSPERTHEDCLAEEAASFGECAPEEDRAVVCDDCFAAFMIWFENPPTKGDA
jgi:hypothetical protein